MRGDRVRSHPKPAAAASVTFKASTVVDFYRSHLKQVVAIHQAMFQKLLFEEDAAVGMDLADLFQDVGKTSLEISERINERYSSLHLIQD